MIDNGKEVNFRLYYDMKLLQLNLIYHITGHISDHIIIKFHNIIIAFFLNVSFDEHIDI